MCYNFSILAVFKTLLMKFFPEKVVKTKTADGKTIVSEIYSLEAYRNNGFLYVIFIMVATGLLAPVISPILLLVYCSEADRRSISLNIVGILVPIYLLIDFNKGWIISALVSLFFKEKELTFVILLNMAMILSHVCCVAGAKVLLHITKGDKLGFTAFIIGLSVLFYFALFIVMKRGSNLNMPLISNTDGKHIDSTLKNSSTKIETVTSINVSRQYEYDSLKQSVLTERKSDSKISTQSIDINSMLQQWANENLAVSIFRNGDIIPEAKTDEEWEKAGVSEQPAWCYLNNDPNNDKLYNWFAVNDPRRIAPQGWHIASDNEWLQLNTCLEKNPEAVNNTNFFSSMLGYREYNGEFQKSRNGVIMWRVTEYNPSEAFTWHLTIDTKGLLASFHDDKKAGFFIRCLKD